MAHFPKPENCTAHSRPDEKSIFLRHRSGLGLLDPIRSMIHQWSLKVEKMFFLFLAFTTLVKSKTYKNDQVRNRFFSLSKI